MAEEVKGVSGCSTPYDIPFIVRNDVRNDEVENSNSSSSTSVAREDKALPGAAAFGGRIDVNPVTYRSKLRP